FGEPSAVVFADLAIAEHLGRFDAMAAEDTAHDQLRKIAIALEYVVACRGARGELASRQRPVGRPRAFYPGEIRAQLFKRLLGQMPVSGDLATEHRQHRRRTSVMVQPKGVVARDGG